MLAALRPRLFGPRILSRAKGTGSFFQDVAGEKSSSSSGVPNSTGSSGSSSAPADLADSHVEYNSNEELRNHPYIASLLNPAPKSAIDLLSPLKRQLYQLNLQQNDGRYVNNQILTLDGHKYKLSLSREEQQVLEPSVYVQSHRIKGSWKKTYMFLRLFRKLELNNAISQCHFSSRLMARDIGEMLTRGSEDAKKLGYDPESLVIDQIWVGKDGEDKRRLQFKGRGRTGVITSHYVHVKAILKPAALIEQRKTWQKERLDRKLWHPLRNWRVKEDLVQKANYKW